jgi:uncharacterized protein with PQ loop repeat
MEMILGYIGVILLSTSGIPQIYRSIKTKNVNGLSPYSLLWVCSGCCCMLSFVLINRGVSILAVSYTMNALFSFTNLMLYLKYKR